MYDIRKYYELVEKCISNLGVDPAGSRAAREGQWSIVKGSAKVWIDVWHIEKEGRAYIQVMCPVIKVPMNRQAEFYEELLRINDKLFGCAFSVYKEWAWLKTIREVEGLDPSEALAMITRIGNYADDYDDRLKEKYPSGGFSAPRSSAPPGKY